MRLRAAILAGLLLILSSVGAAPREAGAFEPINDRYFGYVLYNQLFLQVRDSGEVTWQAVDQYGFPGWRDYVARSLDTFSGDALALGNELDITIREAGPGETPDIILVAQSPSYVAAKCAGSFATACVYITNPLPIPAYFNAASMGQWPYVSIAAVNRHEVFHPLGWACDQYQGGCPPTENLGVRCLGNPDTLMDCNNAARTVTFYDKVTFAVLFTPSPVWGASLDLAWQAVFYGESPANAVGLPACSRVAVLWQTDGFPLAWTGVWGPCGAAPGLYGAGVPIAACTSYYVGAENAVRVSWGRSLVYAGRTPCP